MPTKARDCSARVAAVRTGGDALVAAVDDLAPADVTDIAASVAGGAAPITRVRQRRVARGLERRSVRWERFW